MNAMIRLATSVPLILFLALLAGALYIFATWRRSPDYAKELLIKVFTVLTGGLSILFALASLHALLDGNSVALEIVLTFAAVSIAALAITRICRWRFVKHHPNYRFKRTRTWRL